MVMSPMIYPGITGRGFRLSPLAAVTQELSQAIFVSDRREKPVSGLGPAADRAGLCRPTVVTNSDFRFIVTEQMAAVGIDPGAILIEPAGRNTAPAVLAAALHLAQTDPEGLMLVAPSDHVIPDTAGLSRGGGGGGRGRTGGQDRDFRDHAGPARDRIRLSGTGRPMRRPGTAIDLKRFVEKPDQATAEAMLAAGHYLWNAGIFLFSVETVLKAFEAHAPELVEP